MLQSSDLKKHSRGRAHPSVVRILTDPINCIPSSNSRLPECKSKSYKLSPKFILTWRTACVCILCSVIFPTGIGGMNCPVRSLNVFPLVVRLDCDFPNGIRFFVVRCQNWEVPFLVINAVCFLDFSNSRDTNQCLEEPLLFLWLDIFYLLNDLATFYLRRFSIFIICSRIFLFGKGFCSGVKKCLCFVL